MPRSLTWLLQRWVCLPSLLLLTALSPVSPAREGEKADVRIVTKASLTLQVFKGGVTGMVFTPDGKELVACGKDGCVRVLDAATGKARTFCTLDNEPLWGVKLSRDGKWLATLSDAGVVRVWNFETGKERSLISKRTTNEAIAFSPDGQTLAIGTRTGKVTLWDVETNKEKPASSRQQHDDPVHGLTFSDDGNKLLSTTGDGEYKVTDLKTMRVNTTRLVGKVSAAAFAPEGVALVAALNGTELAVLRLGERETLKVKLQGFQEVNEIAFSPCGTLAAVGGSYPNEDGVSRGLINLCDTASRQELVSYRGEGGAVWCVAFSPTGHVLASATRTGVVQLWDVPIYTAAATLPGHTNAVHAVAFAPDGKVLASASADQAVKLWDAGTRKELAALKGHAGAVRAVAFSPDGKFLATGGGDRAVIVWDAATHAKKTTLAGFDGVVLSLAVAADNKTLAVGLSNGSVRVWDLAAKKQLHALDGHRGPVYGVAFSRDGKTLISGSGDSLVKLWDVAKGEETDVLANQAGVNAMTLSADESLLVAGGSDGSLRLWDVKARRQLGKQEVKGNLVWSAALSPRGPLLASAGLEDEICLWDVSVPKAVNETVRLRGHRDAVRCLSFSPDGKTLASGSSDRTVKLWAIK